MTTLDTFVEQLRNMGLLVSFDGQQGIARCPVRDHGKGRGDLNPSLSFASYDGGRLLVHCHAGCSYESILNAAGIYISLPRSGDSVYELTTNHKKQRRYEYLDENRDVVAVKVYTGRSDRKYTWDRPLKGIQLPLYNLPALLANRERDIPLEVILVEGEKDADTCWKLGNLATTAPGGGTAKLRPNHLETLRGMCVTILCDNDPVGIKRQQTHAAQLLDVAQRVRVAPPFITKTGQGGDVSDWVNDKL